MVCVCWRVRVAFGGYGYSFGLTAAIALARERLEVSLGWIMEDFTGHGRKDEIYSVSEKEPFKTFKHRRCML